MFRRQANRTTAFTFVYRWSEVLSRLGELSSPAGSPTPVFKRFRMQRIPSVLRFAQQIIRIAESTELQFFLRQLHPFLLRLLTTPYSVRPSLMTIEIFSKSMVNVCSALMKILRSPLTSQANLRNLTSQAHPIGQALLNSLKSDSKLLLKSICAVVSGCTYKSKPLQFPIYLSLDDKADSFTL